MSRKIVFINQATGYLTVDVINEFAKVYDNVALVTGSIRIQDNPLDLKVKVSKTIKYNRGNNIRKALSWFIGTFQIFVLLTFRFRNYEKFFYTIPPTAYLLALNFKSKYSIVVYDLYPDALKYFGIEENHFIYRWWERRNKKVFSYAHRVYVIGGKMKSSILKYSPDIRILEIPNWSGFTGYNPVPKLRNGIVKREKLEGKFIVQYSGNIGVTHKVEIIVEIAELLKNQKNIEFLIIGRGDRIEAIGNLIKNKGLMNCRLLPYRKDEELYESLCVADIAVVTLDEKAPDISVPSKLYNIMAAGVPVLAIASPDSTVSQIVHKHELGRSFGKDNITGMRDFIIDLMDNYDKRRKLSMNSLEASKNYTNRNASDYLIFYENLIT